LAPTVAISIAFVGDVARSILNPLSFPLLSVQLRFIWLEDMAVAVRLLGADGGWMAVVVVVIIIVVVVVGGTEVVVVVGRTDVVEVVGSVEVVLVVTMTVVVISAHGVSHAACPHPPQPEVESHKSPVPSPSASNW